MKLFYILFWGIGVYTLQTFVNRPESRLQIFASILVAYVIYTLNQLIMHQSFYQNKYLRYSEPLVIVNATLVPLNLIGMRLNQHQLMMADVIYYLIFNLFVLVINIVQYTIKKNRINN